MSDLDALAKRAAQIARINHPGRPDVAKAVSLRIRAGSAPLSVMAAGTVTDGTLADELAEPEDRLDACLAAFVDQVARELPDPSRPPAKPDQELKKAELVRRHVAQWPSIERDLKDAAENGLRAAAGGAKRGWWREGAALDWARARGKHNESPARPASVFHLAI